MNKEQLVENINKYCALKGVKPTPACRDSGAGRSLINDIERERTPSVERIQMLAQYLGCTVNDLLGETNGKPPPRLIRSLRRPHEFSPPCCRRTRVRPSPFCSASSAEKRGEPHDLSRQEGENVRDWRQDYVPANVLVSGQGWSAAAEQGAGPRPGGVRPPPGTIPGGGAPGR